MPWPHIVLLGLFALSLLLNAISDEEDRYEWRVALPALILVQSLFWLGGFYASLLAPLPLGAWLAQAWPQLFFLAAALFVLIRTGRRLGQVKPNVPATRMLAQAAVSVCVLYLGGFFGPMLLA